MSPSAPKKFHELIATLIDSSPLTQRAIAAKLGYRKANIISMFRKGQTPIPIRQVPALAHALDADPVWLVTLALSEYQPEILETISTTMGFVVTPNEIEILAALRRVTANGDPRVTDAAHRQKLEEFAAALLR